MNAHQRRVRRRAQARADAFRHQLAELVQPVHIATLQLSLEDVADMQARWFAALGSDADKVLSSLESDGVEVTLISAGAPCLCGPGFCATKAGVGFSGYCAGSRLQSAPDCPRCTAPHQSDAGCWACTTRSGANGDPKRLSARAVRLGVSWMELEKRAPLGTPLDDLLTAAEAEARRKAN